MLSAKLAAGDFANRDFNLDADAGVEQIIGVMAHLERHWSAERPKRQGRREEVSSRVAVVLDFPGIMQSVAARDAAYAADEAAVELWGLENESDAGVGALVPVERSEQLAIGRLVGMRAPDTQSWSIGVIRRMAARDAARRCVGIELLARGAQDVEVRDSRSGEHLANGIMLPSPAGRSADQQEINVLLPEHVFSSERDFEMTAFNRRYLLHPLMVVESGKNYEVGRFQIDRPDANTA